MIQTHTISKRIARYFLEHIQDELKKKNSDKSLFDGRSATVINSEILKKLLDLFPELEKEPAPNFHLFREWFRRNEFPIAYDDYLTEAYNIIFFARIQSLLNWSEDAKKNLEKLHSTYLVSLIIEGKFFLFLVF